MAINFNIDNIVINRAIAGTMFDKTTSEPLFYLNQITEPSLECTGEAADVVDAAGIKIASFDRSKAATLSGSSALVNLGLAAAQFGGEKIVASEDKPVEAPGREVLTAVGGKLTLEGTPNGEITFINEMTKDGGLGVPYKLASGETPKANEFTISENKQEITLPADVAEGTKFIVFYKKNVSNGVVIENNADIFAKGGEFVLEVLLADICDTSKVFHGYVVFYNAKMSNETTIDFNNEATHGFSIEAMQDYCDENKRLFDIIVTE